MHSGGFQQSSFCTQHCNEADLCIHIMRLLQALVQDAVLKFKKDGKSSPKTQQHSESDTQQLLSPRNILSMNPAQQTRSSPSNEGRHTTQQV